MTASRYVSGLFLLLCSVSWVAAQQPASAAQAQPCSEPQHKQFDFWIGDWELSGPGAKQGESFRASDSIQHVLDGCAVQESFTGESSPLRGLSLSMFDAATSKWKQTWVDNSGTYVEFAGEFRDGQMVLMRENVTKDGKKALQRMVWKNITPTGLDWALERSLDDGKTWQLLAPVHYKRKA